MRCILKCFWTICGSALGTIFAPKSFQGDHFSHSIFYTTFDLVSEHVWFLFWMRFGSRFGPIFHNFCECPKTLKIRTVLYMAQIFASQKTSLWSQKQVSFWSRFWECVLTGFWTQFWLHLGSLLEPAGLILRIF